MNLKGRFHFTFIVTNCLYIKSFNRKCFISWLHEYQFEASSKTKPFLDLYEGLSVNSITGLGNPKILVGSRKSSHHPSKVIPCTETNFLSFTIHDLNAAK